jgi:hypothetical protein
VAGAEPAAEIAGAVADGHAAQVGADAGLDQPFAGVLAREVGERAVFVRRFGRAEVRVARVLVDEVGQRDLAGRGDLFLGAVADEDRLAEEKDRQLRADGDARDVDAHLAGGLNVGGRVHLVDEGPDGRACDDNAGAGGGVVQKVAAGARLVFCV